MGRRATTLRTVRGGTAQQIEETPMKPTLRLPDDLIEKCRQWAKEVTDHYTTNGDRITAMPWTRDQLSDHELREWLASREDAGRKINIETCELGRGTRKTPTPTACARRWAIR
jgi:hypothetical protein